MTGRALVPEKIEAIFCDIDGTMVDHGEKMPPDELVEAIGQIASNIRFIPVTGRSLKDGEEFLNALPVDIAIAGGGALELRRQAREKPMHRDTTRPTLVSGAILDFWLRQEGGFDKVVVEEVEDRSQYERPREPQSLFVRSLDEQSAHDIADFVNTTRADRLHAAPVISQNGKTYDVHINRDIASKLEAMSTIILYEEKRLVDLGRSILVEDGLGGLQAMRSVGYGVAMGNADSRLKAVADEVIGSQQEGGLLEFLARFSANAIAA